MTTILYAGAEAPDRQALAEATDLTVVSNARGLVAAAGDETIVVPAGTGRDLTSITEAAQALRWLRDTRADTTTLALADSALNSTYTVAYLRKGLREAARDGADGVLFVAHAVDPFADAELFRRVRLAQQYSEPLQISLAFDATLPTKADVFPTVADELHRFFQLGVRRVMLIRADLGLWHDQQSPELPPSMELLGRRPLCSAQSLGVAVRGVAVQARHLLEHGSDGIDAGLLADHDTGFAHSHGDSHAHSHGNEHHSQRGSHQHHHRNHHHH